MMKESTWSYIGETKTADMIVASTDSSAQENVVNS